MLRLALRNIIRQRMRAMLTLAAIALGVASLILSGGFVDDILVQLRETTIHSQLGHLQIYKVGQFASGGHNPFDYLIDDPDAVEKAVAVVPGVAAWSRRLRFSGLLSNGRGELPILGEGIEPEPEARIGTALTLLSGRRLAPADKFGILIGEGLAGALKLKAGDSVDLVLSTVDGATNTLQFSVVGIFRSVSKEYDARAVRIQLNAASDLTATKGVSSVVVLLDDTRATDRARATLLGLLPENRFELKTWQELADFYNNTKALYQRQFLVLQIIILVMVLLSVANTVNMTLYERTGEFGIMRALGLSPGYVFNLAVLETTLIGVVGAVIGVAVGVAFALLISAIGIPMPPPPNSESGFTAAVTLVPWVLAGAFAVGVVGSAVASLLPARRAARVPLVEALRMAI